MNNNQKLPGVVFDMQSVVKSDSRVLALLAGTDIYRIDPYDFAAWEKNNDLFFVPLDEIKPAGIGVWDYYGVEFLNVDGKVYPRNSSWGNLYYNFYMFTPDKADYKVSRLLSTGTGYYSKPPYDQQKNRFIQVSQRYDAFIQFAEQNKSLIFDVNNIGNSDAVSMGEGENSSLVTVLKSEAGNDYWVYSMQTETADNGSNLPLGKYNISACTDITKAVGFVASPVSEDFYYAAEDNIYTLTLKSDNPVAEERFTLDPRTNAGGRRSHQ